MLWIISDAAPPLTTLWSMRPGALPLVVMKMTWFVFVKTLWSIRNGAEEGEPPVEMAFAEVKVKPVILDVADALWSSEMAPATVVVPPFPPASVIPFVLGISTSADQEHVPAGTLTVPPEGAALIAA
jgi:hypothetical protein